ncbi:murein hydrolase activator EnvC family protein [Kiloniella sp.]|uniref:murein hydrolase activator EnvC family protein n=1 Tax=Kiloniella sp. TaxID=1938587 RepID=UPI003B01CA0E
MSCLVCAIFFLPPPALSLAQNTKQKIQTLEQKAAQGKKEERKLSATSVQLGKELSELRGQLIVAARKIQNYESDLTAIEDTLISLKEEATAKKIHLSRDRVRLSRTLSALQRIALLPPEALTAAPGSPVDTVRSAILLKIAVPEIETRVEKLRGDLSELAELKSRIEDERTALLSSRKNLNRERDDLNILIKRKQALQSQNVSSQASVSAQVKKLAQQARDMKDLVKKLEKERKRLALTIAKPKPKPSPPTASTSENTSITIAPAAPEKATQLAVIPDPSQIRDFPSRQKRVLLYPARGRVISKYGQKKGTNVSFDKGLVIATRPSAQVVAPFDGRVVYAGEFRGYGRILIIEHSGRYHTLLAGVERIDVAEGQWVLAGEPVAQMGDRKLEQEEIYFELRRSGQPINPAPWILANTKISNINKVNG